LSLPGNEDLQTDTKYLKARIPTTAREKIIAAVIVTIPMPDVGLEALEEGLVQITADTLVWMTKASFPRIDYA
jgi:hypothetical protein